MRQTLRLEHVKKYYGNHGNITKAVDGISLHVDQGEFVAVMGASGSGKTTLLNCIAAIDSVTSGHIFVSGQDITAIRERDLADFRRENLGFIFQDFNLLDTLTIGENISMAHEPTGALDSKSSRLLLETMAAINQKLDATILMVTHDPFCASFCGRILVLKDGKIFTETRKGRKTRREFFIEILDILTLLGGDTGNVV